jgi:hypothetical protein
MDRAKKGNLAEELGQYLLEDSESSSMTVSKDNVKETILENSIHLVEPNTKREDLVLRLSKQNDELISELEAVKRNLKEVKNINLDYKKRFNHVADQLKKLLPALEGQP